ncbi:MAG: penicillin-binding protein activator [Myxococcaceae bacterium]
MRTTSYLAAAWLLALTACPHNPNTGDGKPHVEVKPDARADAALADAKAKEPKQTRKEAVETYLAVRKAYPETTAGQDALYRAGVLAYEEGDYLSARRALNELVFENPLYPQATEARLKAGLAAYELKQYRDAYQALSTLVDKLEGDDKKRAEDALAKSAAATQQYGDALKLAVKAVEDAQSGTDDQKKAALAQLEKTVETQVSFIAITEVQHEMSPSHPAWPALTFKLGRIYYHLRDWPRLDETLKSLLHEAPNSPYAADAKALLDRVARRGQVKPKVVGAVLPMSGKYKALGEAVLRGIQLELKGTDIELVVKDSKGDVNEAGKMVEELAFDDGAIAIIGPLLSDDSRRAALVAEELQVPIVTLSRADGITNIGSYVFRNMLTNSQQAEALADYAVGTLGYKSFGVLYPNIPFGTEMTNEFWDELEKRGAKITAAETYSHDQTTFTSEAQGLVGRLYKNDRAEFVELAHQYNEDTKGMDDFHKKKAREKLLKELEPVIDFDALLLPDSWQRVSLVAPALAVEDIITNGCNHHDMEKIQKTTGKTKVKTVLLLGPSTWSSPKNATTHEYELVERGQKFVECGVYVDGFWEGSKRPATKTFVDNFHDQYKDQTPLLLDALGYDTAGMLKQVIDKSSPKSRGELRDRLSQLKDYDGATGTTRFDDAREARKPLFMLEIDPRKGVKELDMPAPKKGT